MVDSNFNSLLSSLTVEQFISVCCYAFFFCAIVFSFCFFSVKYFFSSLRSIYHCIKKVIHKKQNPPSEGENKK